MWYIVLLDATGDKDEAIAYDHMPTEAEWHDEAQSVGYHYAGYVEAESPEQAIEILSATFDGSGCAA